MRITRQHVITFSLVLLLGVTTGGAAWAQDPGTAGPLAVTVQEYNFGDTAFNPPSGFPGPVEVRAQVHRPTNLAGGPFPLVIFMHGRHGVCSSSFTWPCPAGQTIIPSYQGYAYVASILASHGYIVVSVSANGINAQDNSVFDLGMQARAELIQHHLDIWDNFNTAGGAPFGTTFVGRVDMNNVGTMGHSRGGEGVMRHVLHNRALGSPYGIKAVFPLAPVDFNRPIVNDVPFNVLLPYCDGDVSDLQGAHFYDDARYSSPGDLTAKYTLLVMGANHNFYNTVWTPGFGFPASDDWGVRGDPVCDSGSAGRLSAAEQRGTGLAYMSGFFRRHLGGETQFDPMLKGDVSPPPSAMSDEIYPSYHAPAGATSRRDVNRWLTASHLTTNHLGGAVTQSGFTPYDLCGGASPQPQHCLPFQSTSRQPHTTVSARASGMRGLSQVRGGWTAATAHLTNALPAGSRDVSTFQVFQFRAAVNFDDVRNLAGVAQDLTVRLTDGAGATADAIVSAHSPALFYPPGLASAVPKVVLNTVRIPLTAFSGINLTDVRTVALRFNQTGSGALLMSDFAFADAGGPPPAPADLVETTLTNPPATVQQGGSFGVTDTVQNQGAGGAGVSTTRYYFSLDTTKSASDVLLTGSRSVPALAPAATSNGGATVTVPASTPLNTYFLLACADDLGVVSESAEGNNCRASATTVQVQAGTAGADLVVTALSNPPATAAIGTKFQLTVTVQNQGTSDVVVPTLTRFYLSADQTKNAGDKLLGGNVKILTLAAGASFTKTKRYTVKLSTAPGQYWVIACADDKGAGAVTETNEANNCRVSTTRVTIF
jgi:hypothetical protein